MIRTYKSGVSNNVRFFVGTEVEKTAAFGQKTLFVTGFAQPSEIKRYLKDCTHIFFGANHSLERFSEKWLEMMVPFLDQGILCSLDIPLDQLNAVLGSLLNEYKNFIPQVRVMIPQISTVNPNLSIKIDDRGFNFSNPGVWCTPLTSITTDQNFTPWDHYANDEIIK